MYDPELYRTKEEVARWKKRDPIDTFVARLRGWRVLTDADLHKIEQEAAAEIEEAVAFAEAGPWEPVEDLMKDVMTPVNQPKEGEG
jgi:TPP-dependent pyruvate/acetoin dehydrogenase alpha subunit